MMQFLLLVEDVGARYPFSTFFSSYQLCVVFDPFSILSFSPTHMTGKSSGRGTNIASLSLSLPLSAAINPAPKDWKKGRKRRRRRRRWRRRKRRKRRTAVLLLLLFLNQFIDPRNGSSNGILSREIDFSPCIFFCCDNFL